MPKEYLTPLALEKCPICEAAYMGGHVVPGQRLQFNKKIFYRCGCSVSVVSGEYHNSFEIKIQNCWCKENYDQIEKEVLDLEKIAVPELQEFDPMRLNKKLENKDYFYIGDVDDHYYIELDEDEATITKGIGILPIFTTKEKAEKYQSELNEEDQLGVKPLSKKRLKSFSDLYSHVIVDPKHMDDGFVPCADVLLSKIE